MWRCHLKPTSNNWSHPSNKSNPNWWNCLRTTVYQWWFVTWFHRWGRVNICPSARTLDSFWYFQYHKYQQTVSLCSNCFMTVYDKAFNTYTLEALCRKTMNDPTKILGTNKLKPERTTELYHYTRRKILKQSDHDLDLKVPFKTLSTMGSNHEGKYRVLSKFVSLKVKGLDTRILDGTRNRKKEESVLENNS